jgi:hypothetical protein
MVMNFPKLLFLCSVYCVLSFAQTQNPGPQDARGGSITHVHTALGHVSLLEFREPVTAAAAGSRTFHIERFENKVLITPSKAGVSTNLFVWTATQRFSYELDPPGETASTVLAIDAPAPEPKPAIDVKQQQTQFLAQTLLANGVSGAQRIDSSRVKLPEDAIAVLIEHVFRDNDTLYVYFVVANRSKQPFRITQPAVYQLEADRSSSSLQGLVNRQLSPKLVAHVGSSKPVPVPIAYAEFQARDLSPGARKAGVIAVQLAPSSPTILRLVFADSAKATFVL